MLNRENWAIKKINIYFFLMVFAFGMSAYLLLLDNSTKYASSLDILISPKNIKTAIYLKDIKENILEITKKNNIVDEDIILKISEKNSLISITANSDSVDASKKLTEKSARKLLDSISKYYDIKNDLSLLIVSRENKVEFYNRGLLVSVSLLFGVVASFGMQLLLDLTEKIILSFIAKKKIKNRKNIQAREELNNFFKINREKIQKLSLPLYPKNKNQKEIDSEKFNININFDPAISANENFKKASSPANLPIATDDLNRIMQVENEINEGENLFKDEVTFNDELRDAFKEPTEDEFKKRLNQLLGNK